jgi:hypothetical protein
MWDTKSLEKYRISHHISHIPHLLPQFVSVLGLLNLNAALPRFG